MQVTMTRTQFKVLLAAMIDRKKTATPPLNAFGNNLHDAMLEAWIKEQEEVDLTKSA